jgi:hypothetical protein
MAGSDDRASRAAARLAAVAGRQRREIARLRARRERDAAVAMATGALAGRHGLAPAEAAARLAAMAAGAGLPLHEMAAAVLRDGARDPAAGEAPAAMARDDGAELAAALAGQLRARSGAMAAAVWLLGPDGALDMLAQAGLGGTEASRWRRIPPQFDCAEQRVAAGGADIWQPPGSGTGPVPGRAAARAVLALRDRAGITLGVAEAWWERPGPGAGPALLAELGDLAAGFARLLAARADTGEPARVPGTAPGTFGLLDDVTESALVARPVRDARGNVTDFAIVHLSPGFADPAGRPAAGLAGRSLLEAYPGSGPAAGEGLFAIAARVLESGTAEHVPGEITAPLAGEPGGRAGARAIADLRAAPCHDGVVFTWRELTVPARIAALVGDAARLGHMGAWEENLVTGTVYWTDTAFTVFGLDPVLAAPIPLEQLHSFVIAADRAVVLRLREQVLQQRAPAAALFRIMRPGDAAGVLRQIRIFAESAVAGTAVVAVRGAFQDISGRYHAEVALAATRDRLADTEQRADSEHRLALALQRAIMPARPAPVRASGVDIAVRYLPAEPGHLVGGDWYDVTPLPGGEMLLVVGDITGHGIDAVTGMVGARNALRGLAVTGAGPAELLGHLNAMACHLSDGIAGTVVCGIYEPGTRQLRWARAGHLPPVLVRGGTAAPLPLPEGVLLGLDPGAAYEEARLALRPGDALLLFTDGLIERRETAISDALAGLAAAAVPAGPDAAAHADRVLAAAVSDTGDDACLVTVRIL